MRTLTEIRDIDETEKALDEIIILLMAFVKYKQYRWKARNRASRGGSDGVPIQQ
jgi:hypothetical protein